MSGKKNLSKLQKKSFRGNSAIIPFIGKTLALLQTGLSIHLMAKNSRTRRPIGLSYPISTLKPAISKTFEASRFDWVVTLSRAYAVTNDVRYLQTLNEWLKDWCKHNPLNIGPNWKCGQEVSIRVFNLINASFILQQNNNPTTALIQLIEAHLKRIQLNICYAIAQDNNHGTSEAAGLFIGGSWLSNINVTQKLLGPNQRPKLTPKKVAIGSRTV